MRNNNIVLGVIILVAAFAIYIALPLNHPVWLENAVSWGQDTPRDLKDITRGLDLSLIHISEPTRPY